MQNQEASDTAGHIGSTANRRLDLAAAIRAF